MRASFDGDISDQEVKVKQGKQAKFQCGAVGYPLEVEWKRQKKNEDKIECISEWSVTLSSLVLSSLDMLMLFPWGIYFNIGNNEQVDLVF